MKLKDYYRLLVAVVVSGVVASVGEMSFAEGAPRYTDGRGDINNGTSTTLSLSRVLDFYNTELLASSWGRYSGNVSEGCGTDLGKYVEGLRNVDNWALKMDDASGRYSTGWFWGNHYWTGSQSLCENIAPKHENNQTRVQRNVGAQEKTNVINPSLSKGYTPGRLSYSSVPPFQISFFMLRVNVTSSFNVEARTLHVGLCLPDTCTDDDVKIVFEETSKASPKIAVHVEAVRSPHQHYDIWEDTTFRILCLVTASVVVLLAAGTGYDLYLKHVDETKKIITINRTTYTNPNRKFGDKSITLDMSMPEPTSKNGKCSLYVVNNNNNNNNNGLSTGDIEVETTRIGVYWNLLLGLAKDLLLSFSMRVNIKHICDRSVGSDTIPVIHGLKSISMAWVILGHTCLIAFKYSDNMEYRKVVQKEFFFQMISNGAFSVDTFFFTSGLLVSFLYFRTNAKGKLDTLGNKGLIAGFLHFMGLIFYRFVRLSAPYLFILGVVEVCMKWFNYNSIFEPPTMDHENCPQYWWRNILYINTLFPVEQMCMLWSWYLSDDTQFYMVGAIMLILATSHFKSAASLVVIFMVSSWMTTGYVAFSNSFTPTSDDPLALFDKIYDKPYTRLGPYLIGMCVGWILFKTNCRINMSKLTLAVGWLSSSACLLSLVFGLYEADLSPVVGAAYSSLSHSAWALGLAWIVIACTTGHGGYVNSILSATILYPFSRVTYCAYLLHPIVIRMMAMNMDSPLHLGKEVMVILFLGQVVASYALGFLVSLAFEAPVVSMLRILSRIPANRKARAET